MSDSRRGERRIRFVPGFLIVRRWPASMTAGTPMLRAPRRTARNVGWKMLRWTDEQLAAYRKLQGDRADAKREATAKAPGRSKHRNKRTEIGGAKFDSKAEAARWVQLRRMEEAGLIRDLRRQVSFELAPAVKIQGRRRMSPPLRYFADFVYQQDDKEIIEDVKGQEKVTEGYRIKRHLMAVLGYHIVEVRGSAARRAAGKIESAVPDLDRTPGAA